MEEKPNDWPSSGSYDVTSALINSYPKGTSYMRDLFVPPFGEAAGWKHKIVARVYNNDPGKPTVLLFGGSAEDWDGSSNFNFMKEVMRRYTGLPPVKVFAKPMVSPASASKFDEGFSFPLFLAKMPINVFKNIVGAVWTPSRIPARLLTSALHGMCARTREQVELECTDLAGREHDPSERQDDHPRGLVHVGSRDRRVAPRFDGGHPSRHVSTS